MPLVEVIPQATAPTAPGYAYVPDTGFDPSKAPIIPSGARVRAARNVPNAASGEQSARQHSKVIRHLAELDKENNKDVQIVVPDRSRDVAKRGLRDHMTPGVKKILLSQKTLANHIADEEATGLSMPSDGSVGAHLRQPQNRDGKSFSVTSKGSTIARAEVSGFGADSDQPHEETQNGQFEAPASVRQDLRDLIVTNVPSLPTPEQTEALLSLPPLSHSAARALPTKSSAPAHTFCDMCGYWGRVRCMKCGARVCSLDCKTQHEETTCQKFYA